MQPGLDLTPATTERELPRHLSHDITLAIYVSRDVILTVTPGHTSVK